jgi:hypothetical protein
MTVDGGEAVPADKSFDKISTSCNQCKRIHCLTPNHYDVMVQRDMFHFISLLSHILKKNKNTLVRSPCCLRACLSVYVFPLPLLGNGSVKAFPR